MSLPTMAPSAVANPATSRTLRSRTVRYLLALLAVAASSGSLRPVAAQIPDSFKNLKVLPSDIGRDSLVMLMRSFSFATGLRCRNCHVMGEGGSFVGAQFDLDDKLPKRQARVMLRMVNRLNDEMLTELPGRADPPLRVECKTCHRGIRRPFLLRTELRSVIDREGAQAAIRRYRELRESAMSKGVYDFGVWEMNELARELVRDGRDADAAAMLELNEEFHPRDPSIPRELGLIYERLGERDKAVAAYRRALGLDANDSRSLEHLRALEPVG